MPKRITSTQFLAAGAIALLLVAAAGAAAKVEGDTVVLGAPVSLTGKYSVNGKNTKDGYEIAVTRLNEKGGVQIDGKTYKLTAIYYDDESTPARGAPLTARLTQHARVKSVLGASSS